MSKIRMVEQASAPGTPGTNEVLLYVDASSQLATKNDAGTVRTTPAVEAANTFSATQTFSGIVKVGLFDNPADISIANDAAREFNYSAAIVLIHDRSSGAAGMFLLKGSAVSTVELLDSGALFTVTKDTPASWNVYYEAPSYWLQNKVGADRIVHIWEFA